jgi:hypothetical protein
MTAAVGRTIASSLSDFCRHVINAVALCGSVMSLPSSVATTPGEMIVVQMSSCS